MEIKQYIKENEARFMEELFSLIRIPSISALPEHKDDMLACALRWKELLLAAGADEAMVMPSQGNPLVFAQKHVSNDAPTLLIYAHYDVMPAEPLDLWKSQPFEPEIRDGHIWYEEMNCSLMRSSSSMMAMYSPRLSSIPRLRAWESPCRVSVTIRRLIAGCSVANASNRASVSSCELLFTTIHSHSAAGKSCRTTDRSASTSAAERL